MADILIGVNIAIVAYLAPGVYLTSVWFIDDAVADGLTTLGWAKIAVARVVLWTVAGMFIGGFLFAVDKCVCKFILKDNSNLLPLFLALLAFGIIVIVSMYGSAFFFITKPYI